MRNEEVRARVKRIIAEVADLDEADIGDDARFVEDLDLDSLALLEIGVDVDYAFKLGVPDERLRELRTVDEAVALAVQILSERERRSEAG